MPLSTSRLRQLATARLVEDAMVHEVRAMAQELLACRDELDTFDYLRCPRCQWTTLNNPPRPKTCGVCYVALVGYDPQEHPSG